MAFLAGLIFLFSGMRFVFAEPMSPDQDKALSQVVDLLTDPKKLHEIVGDDPKAKEADRFLRSVGGEHSGEIYQLAAEIFQSLAAEAQGDPEKMERLLEKAKQDPTSFAKKFTAGQKSRLREIAGKIEKSKVNP